MILYHRVHRSEAVVHLAALGVPRSSQKCIDDLEQLNGISGQYFLLIEDANALRIPADIWFEVQHCCTVLLVKRKPASVG